MLYVLIALVLAGLIYAGWRVSQSAAARPHIRITGPDDDPEFLRRIGNDNPSEH